MLCGIYTIYNKLSNKYYVGSSIDVEKRIREHISELKGGYHKNEHLLKSFLKYGKENFEFEILEECDEQFLYSQESYWCNLLNTYDRNFGYNIEIVLPEGKRISEETKKKISDIRKEQYKDPTKNPFYGRTHSKETRLKMSLKGKGLKKKPWSEETRKKILSSRPSKYKTKKKCNIVGI